MAASGPRATTDRGRHLPFPFPRSLFSPAESIPKYNRNSRPRGASCSMSVARKVLMGNLVAWPVRLPSPYAAHFGNASPLSGILSYEETSVLPIVWSGKAMTEARVLVSVVDDDESVRESLPDLLQ